MGLACASTPSEGLAVAQAKRILLMVLSGGMRLMFHECCFYALSNVLANSPWELRCWSVDTLAMLCVAQNFVVLIQKLCDSLPDL